MEGRVEDVGEVEEGIGEGESVDIEGAGVVDAGAVDGPGVMEDGICKWG